MTVTERSTPQDRSPASRGEPGPAAAEPSIPPGSPGPREHRLSALDGIRAFAVLAVLLYHGGVAWVSGGLLGVDVFFVLSGYLITTLLCREFLVRRAIRLGRFWAARARRLLPALLVLLLGVAAFAYFFSAASTTPSIRGDALSTLLYVANWHFIFSDQNYFVRTGAPSPLLHTWSLSVEEQYYLVWPLVALWVLRRHGRQALVWVAGIGALASAGLMLALDLTHAASTSALYYSTSTRAQALLVGSAIGAFSAGRGWQAFDPAWSKTPRGRWTGLLLGTCGAAWLLWAWHDLEGQSSFLYQGGFLLVALGAGAVIVSVTCWPTQWLARLCSWRPLVGLGRISYGVYLYHWPIFLVLDNARTGLTGVWLFSARLAATLVASTLSFRYLEEPIRQRRWHLPHWRRSWTWSRGRWEALAAAVGVVVTGVVLVLATANPAPAQLSTRQLGLSAQASLSPSERTALAASHAFGADPIRFTILGDSEALTTAIGLSQSSVSGYGVHVDDGAWLGCDLDAGLPIEEQGVWGPPATTKVCADWRTLFPKIVADSRAEVVGILFGRFELMNHLWHGQVAHLGQPAWDSHLRAELEDVVRLVSAHGAKVVIFTVPYIDPPTEALNGQPYPENQPSRVRVYNRILVHVAHRFPKVATVIPLNAILDPHGTYQAVVDGVTVRWPDGIHVTRAGGEWLQPRILPAIGQLGLAARAEGGRGG